MFSLCISFVLKLANQRVILENKRRNLASVSSVSLDGEVCNFVVYPMVTYDYENAFLSHMSFLLDKSCQGL